jgi:hypothetical protein
LLSCSTVQIIDVLGKIPYTHYVHVLSCTIFNIWQQLKKWKCKQFVIWNCVKVYCQNKQKLIEQKCGKELTRLHMNCTYWVVGREDSRWQLRICNFDLEIFCFNLTSNYIYTFFLYLSSWSFYLPLSYHQTPKPGWTQVLMKSKQFLPLIRHPSCYSCRQYVVDTTLRNTRK